MKLDNTTFNEAMGILDSMVRELKYFGEETQSKEFIHTAKVKIREFSDKYSTTHRLGERDINTIFRYFGNAIDDTHAFLRLLKGELIVDSVDTEDITLKERKVDSDMKTYTFRFREE